mgnify:CR=1 FL=1
MSEASTPMAAEWVVGHYRGKDAERVLGLGDEGIGYIILDRSGRGQTLEAVVAFRRAIDSPLPVFLEQVTDPKKIEKYENQMRRHKKE